MKSFHQDARKRVSPLLDGSNGPHLTMRAVFFLRVGVQNNSRRKMTSAVRAFTEYLFELEQVEIIAFDAADLLLPIGQRARMQGRALNLETLNLDHWGKQ